MFWQLLVEDIVKFGQLHKHQMFGGRSLILADDSRQLPPVSGSPMFTKGPDFDKRYMDAYSKSIFSVTPIRTSAVSQSDWELLKLETMK